MRIVPVIFAILVGSVFAVPVFAEGSGVSINIVGGSEAGQSCVSAKNCYVPDTITIQPSTLVAWTNMDTVAHTVTSGKPSENETGSVFDSDQIAPGGTYSFLFMSPGTYNYFCSIHPWMEGTIIVGNEINPSNGNVTVPEFGPAVELVFVASALFAMLLARNRLNFRSHI